jgi:hypothetical protein
VERRLCARQTPPAIVAKLEAELRDHAAAMQEKLGPWQLERPAAASPNASIDAETKMWADVAKAANLKFEQ